MRLFIFKGLVSSLPKRDIKTPQHREMPGTLRYIHQHCGTKTAYTKYVWISFRQWWWSSSGIWVTFKILFQAMATTVPWGIDVLIILCLPFGSLQYSSKAQVVDVSHLSSLVQTCSFSCFSPLLSAHMYIVCLPTSSCKTCVQIYLMDVLFFLLQILKVNLSNNYISSWPGKADQNCHVFKIASCVIHPP